jgi:hypothetical protein
MSFATQFWFVDLPWWAFWPLAALGLLVVAFLAFVLWEALDDWKISRWQEKEEDKRVSAEVVYPYYAESESLRNLAHAVKFDLPTGRQVTKSKKLSFTLKGTGGETGDSETQEYGSQLPVLELATKVEESWTRDGTTPATQVAHAASVSDEGALSAAIEQLQRDFPATSQTAELLSRVQEAFSGERIEALAVKKREEFEAVAKRNQLMVFRGQFGFKQAGREGCGPTLKLTHFNPTPGYLSPRSSGEGEGEADLIPVPEGVGLDVVLPDGKALTAAGRERIQRPEPFYAGVIAHSPSFNKDTGTLTCSAWAIWGQKMPDWSVQVEPPFHRYGGARGAPYAC